MRFQDKRVTFGSKISDRVWKDNNGQLICHDCILSRTGYYDYLESDILRDGDPTKIVQVYRTPEEVFDPESIASFENKPFCNDHPEEDVTPSNYKDLQVGYVRNIRRGTGDLSDCLIGDIIVTDQEVIDLILSGEKRQLSLGYDSIIEKDESGRYLMKKIRGNHLALVDEGRAGCATIRDKKSVKNNLGGSQGMKKSLFKTSKTKLYDEDIIEVEEIDEETPIISEETLDEDYELEEVKEADEDVAEEAQEEVHDEDSPIDAILKRLDEIEARLTKLETPATTDEDTTEEVEQNEEIVEDEDDIEEDIEATDDDIEEEFTDEDEVEELADEDVDPENTLLDADEEITEPETEPTKKTDSAAKTYSKFAGMKNSRKTQDQAIEKAALAAWKKRYKIK